MKLGMEAGLGPAHIVLDGDPAPSPYRGTALFLIHVCCGQTAGWIRMPLGMEVSLDPGDIVLAGINQSSFITGMTERTRANTQPGSPREHSPQFSLKITLHLCVVVLPCKNSTPFNTVANVPVFA